MPTRPSGGPPKAWLLLLGVVLGCSSTKSVPAPPLLTTGTATEVANRVGCAPIQMLPSLGTPIRTRAAVTGVRCRLHGAAVDIFERGPIERCESGVVACGGSVAHIDEVLDTAGPPYPRCHPEWVLIARRWFIVSNSRSALSTFGPAVGGQVQPVIPVGSPASYDFPGCPG